MRTPFPFFLKLSWFLVAEMEIALEAFLEHYIRTFPIVSLTQSSFGRTVETPDKLTDRLTVVRLRKIGASEGENEL